MKYIYKYSTKLNLPVSNLNIKHTNKMHSPNPLVWLLVEDIWYSENLLQRGRSHWQQWSGRSNMRMLDVWYLGYFLLDIWYLKILIFGILYSGYLIFGNFRIFCAWYLGYFVLDIWYLDILYLGYFMLDILYLEILIFGIFCAGYLKLGKCDILVISYLG